MSNAEDPFSVEYQITQANEPSKEEEIAFLETFEPDLNGKFDDAYYQKSKPRRTIITAKIMND